MAICRGTEAPTPLGGRTRSTGIFQHVLKTWITCCDKLCSMIKRGLCDPSRGHSSAHTTSLVNEHLFSPGLLQGGSGGESCHASADDKHVCTSTDEVVHGLWGERVFILR